MRRPFLSTALVLAILLIMSVVMIVDMWRYHYIMDTAHYMALALLAANTILLFFNHKWAVLCTGIMILLGLFNLAAFTAVISWFSISIGTVKSPGISIPLFWIFLLYVALHYNMVLNWYWDYKDARKK